MTDNTQPEALRLADMLTADEWPGHVTLVSYARECVAELRRQHARITELEAQLEAIGAGGVNGPLMGQPQAMPDLSALTERGAKAWAGVDAQGLRDGVASVAASAPAPSGHIKEPYTLAEIKAKIASNDYSAEMLLQHAMLLLDSASLSANAGEPVAFLVCTEEGDPDMVFLGRLEACQYCEDDDPPKPLYLATPPTAQAEGWRPIETAPKDGSYLLLWEQYSDAPFVGYWSGGSWSVSHEHVDAEGGWDGANVVDALSMPITHWMPIPAPPASAEGVEHGPQ